ncbi:dihydrolipoamide acetyltransferase family protein [Hydrogenimonas sp.]
MAYEIVMPQLSDSMEEGKLIAWKVKPGDRVKQGDVIAEVESDKAVMEVQTFKDGVVEELKLREGQSAPVGSVIAVIETGNEAGGVKPTPPETKPAPAGKSPEEKRKSGAAPEESHAKSPTPETKPAPSGEAKNAPASHEAEPSIVDELFGGDTEEPKAAAPVEGEASPRARALAAKWGIDIQTLQKEGKIPTPAHAEDIEKYYLSRYFTPKARSLLERYGLSYDLFESGKKHDEAEVMAYIEAHDIALPKPLSPMRKAIIATVTEAAKRPVFHIYDHLDATLALQFETKERTLTVWLLKLFAEAMRRHETMRTTLDGQGLRVWPGASISLAMAHGEALYMPVFKNLDTMSVDEIAEALAKMKEKVAAGRVEPQALQGSTFGLSNLGMTGIERFDAMINKNDCGIAAIGAAVEGRIAVTLTLDHRIVDGWQGAEFMQTLKSLATDRNFFEGA